MGRPLFLWSRAPCWRPADPVYAEPVLRWFGAGPDRWAAPALMVLARALGLARGAAFAAGAALACHRRSATSHQVLTDSRRGICLSIAALAIAAGCAATYPRASRRALVAAAVAMRENRSAQLVGIVLLLGWRWGERRPRLPRYSAPFWWRRRAA